MYRRAVLRVVVAGPDVDVVAHAVALAAHDQDALGVGLQRRVAVDDVDARLLQRPRPADVRALVEARLELDQADRLLAALGGPDERRHERRVVATCGTRSCLIARTSGSSTACSTKRSTEVDERVVGVVDEDVALADRGEHVGRSSSSPCRRGWVTGVHGGSRSSVKPGSSAICQRSLRSSRPAIVVDLRAPRRAAPRTSCWRRAGLMPALDLDAHDLAEAAPAQLGLDRLEEVVGLVGDLEVGVARDAEDAVVEDLHAREERVEVARR